jgi:putative sigma-54 modulation protein
MQPTTLSSVPGSVSRRRIRGAHGAAFFVCGGHGGATRRATSRRAPQEEAMQIKVSGHSFEVSPALREYAIGKLARVERHFERLIDVHVILATDKLVHRAEATLVSPQKTIHAFGESNDMYAAIDALADKLDRQVRKHKEKLTDHHRGETTKLRASI